MTNKICCVCSGALDEDVKFLLPTPHTAYIYGQLVDAGMASQAMVYLKVNEPTFLAYCMICWIYSYVKPAMEDPDTSDEEKSEKITKHFNLTFDAAGSKDAVWSKIGNPNWN